ncbi:hypothetical protein SSS_00279 [Sarcoptes scabiei]|nr:hypothetical protein SSS_00279 [Sarcoptes scabiei]
MSSDIREYITNNDIRFENESDIPDSLLLDYQTDRRLSKTIHNRMLDLGFTNATPIQAISLPIALNGRDLIGISKTGSGKTLAFVLPSFIYLEKNPQPSFTNILIPEMLVLSPTRELALQTHDVFNKFEFFRSVCLYGGSSRHSQISEIKSKHPRAVIGTPGRIIDFLNSRIIDLKKCNYLVCDEADRLLDMGFYPQIEQILDCCPSSSNRQTLFFSATWDYKVQKLSKLMLKNDRVLISIGPLFTLNACPTIKQHLFLVEKSEKKKLLLRTILSEFAGMKLLIFTNTKRCCETMSNYVNKLGLTDCDYIHGDLSQENRQRVIRLFDNNKLMVIFATDVAARGLVCWKIMSTGSDDAAGTELKA